MAASRDLGMIPGLSVLFISHIMFLRGLPKLRKAFIAITGGAEVASG